MAITGTPTVEALAKSGAHFAHVKSKRHPSMKKFILGTKNKMDLIDLSATEEFLDTAKTTIERYGAEGKKIMFVTGKNESIKITRAIAEDLEMPFVAGRWLGGTFTNFTEIRKRINRMADLESWRESGELEKKYTKLERLMLSREENKLKIRMGGLAGLTKIPDLVVIVDTNAESIAVNEARLTGVPTIGIMSTDCDLTDATYPIVANDASVKTVTYILEELSAAFKKGQGRKVKEDEKKEATKKEEEKKEDSK
ncbi:30S ribosomal protein S2 [Candidatus Wolfebacteria bacterium]|nr:30S ribosomal protein S2 [Candidatus Wolfebacteria bacterium]